MTFNDDDRILRPHIQPKALNVVDQKLTHQPTNNPLTNHQSTYYSKTTL